MSTPIEQNTTALEELLGMAESLPNRSEGTGSGGITDVWIEEIDAPVGAVGITDVYIQEVTN